MAVKLAVLLSGSGTTLQNLIDRIDSGALDATIACVISSREGVKGLDRAREHGIPAEAITRKKFGDDTEAFSDAIWNVIASHEVDLVCLAGFMSLIRVPDEYEARIMNTHPALIPSFCGKGMYVQHVHQAVIDYGCKLTGATIHFVDNEYDNGPIIVQESVPVYDDDTVDSLAARVQATEREIYPRAIQLFAEGRLRLEGRHVRVL